METKAISKYNAAVTIQSGRVGNVRYYQKGGETFVRSATVSSKDNARSDAQMQQRLLFASLNHFYSLFGKKLRGAFTQKKKTATDCNAFMQANQGVGVYFTKDQNLVNSCVVLPAIISLGKLGYVNCTIGETAATSDIACNATITSGTTTIKELTNALIAASDKYADGDTLTLFMFKNVVVNNIPSVEISTAQWKLSKTDSTVVSGISCTDGKLVFNFGSFDADGAAVVHMGSDGKVSISKIGMNADAVEVMNSYLTDEVFQTARDSYGTVSETFLAKRGLITTDAGSSDTGSSDTGSSDAGSSDSGSSTTTKYTLNLAASPTNGGTVSGAGSYAAGTSVNISAVANSGYTFSQWSDGNTNASRSVTVNADQTLTAIFVASGSENEGGGAQTGTDGQLQ